MHYLEIVDHLPSQYLQRVSKGYFPKGALALATATVERAFNQWWVGKYQPLPSTQAKFNRRLWGPKTAEFMESLSKANEKFWKCVIDRARAYKGKYKAPDEHHKSFVTSAMQGKSSGRATCFAT
jgi:hypothetical protein